MEVHARILLPVAQLASEASSAPAPALCCQPLVISMAQLLTPPPCPPQTAQEMLALWASLPVQVWSYRAHNHILISHSLSYVLCVLREGHSRPSDTVADH